MTKTVSARITNETHEELRERCNKVGCSINDYISESINFMLHGSSEFDFVDEEEGANNDSKQIELKNNHGIH